MAGPGYRFFRLALADVLAFFLVVVLATLSFGAFFLGPAPLLGAGVALGSFLAAMRHRILLNFEGQAEGITSDQILTQILETIPTTAQKSVST